MIVRCARGWSAFRHDQRRPHPDWFNAPVPVFGDPEARLLIVGLAPGLQGANRTGRPFTGDYAGHLLYATLIRFGFAEGHLCGASRMTASCSRMRSLPMRCAACRPQTSRLPDEIKTCNPFLEGTDRRPAPLAAIVALGRIAHDAASPRMAQRRAAFRFAHGAQHATGRSRFSTAITARATTPIPAC